MRFTPILIVVLALAALGACREKRTENAPPANAPAEGAPRDKVAIEAPAQGSAKDASVTVTEPGSAPHPGDRNRTYEEGVTEKDLGVPFYPGSKEVRPGGRITDSAGKAAQSFRRTSAPVADVIGFYRKRLDVVLHEIVDAASTTLVGEEDGMQVTVIAIKRSDWTEVSVFTKRSGAR